MKWCVGLDSISPRSLRWFIAMYLGAMTATSMVVWLGQLVVLLLALIVFALTLISRQPEPKTAWKCEVVAALLMLFALVKPSVSAPFLWLLLWSPARPRAALATVLGYVFLTLVALSLQQNGAREMLGWAETVNRNGALLSEGYANLRVWLAGVGLKAWSHPAAIVVFVWSGFWTHRHRHAHLLLRLGVVGLVARIWTYHNSYDDVLLILPMLALLQIGARDSQSPKTGNGWAKTIAHFQSPIQQARWLFALFVALLLLLPDWVFAPSAWGAIARAVTSLTMLAALGFLLRFTKNEDAGRAPSLSEPQTCNRKSRAHRS